MLPLVGSLLASALCYAEGTGTPPLTGAQFEKDRRAEAAALPVEGIPIEALEAEEDDACSRDAGAAECALRMHQLRGAALQSKAAAQQEVHRHNDDDEPLGISMQMIMGVPLYTHPEEDKPESNVDLKAAAHSQNQWILNLKVAPGFGDENLQGGPDLADTPPVIVVRGSMEDLEREIQSYPNVIFVEEDTAMRMVPELDNEEEVDMGTLLGAGKSVTDWNPPPSWGLDRIDAKEGLDHWYDAAGYGGAGVHVYMLDTGIMTTHEDFGGRAIPTLEVNHQGLRLCEMGDTTCAMDELGHGTHTAGTVGGRRFGVAKGVTLHACKTLDHRGTGMISWMILALDWVSVNGTWPMVISASLGGRYDSPSLQRSIDRTVASGVTVVVAAGNENDDACKYMPAKVKSAITVGAIAVGDMRAPYSNWGQCLDIFAPGSSINSLGTDSNTSMTLLSGTSMACPHVAGAVALLLAQDNHRTPEVLRKILLSKASVKQGPIDTMAEEEDAIDIYYGKAQDEELVSTADEMESEVQGPHPYGSPKLMLYTDPEHPRPISPKWPPRFEVYDGPCKVDSDGCATSDGFGVNDTYGNSQRCNILILGDIGHVHVESFETEDSFDALIVNFVRYSGSLTGAASLLECVKPKGAITWSSDRTDAKSGWKVCPERRPSATAAAGFYVGCGQCQRDAQGCVTSPNYPRNYSNHGSCYIDVVGNVPRMTVNSFMTEANYDMLWVNGKNYSGTVGPQGEWPGRQIIWKSDAEEVSQGWKICPVVA